MISRYSNLAMTIHRECGRSESHILIELALLLGYSRLRTISRDDYTAISGSESELSDRASDIVASAECLVLALSLVSSEVLCCGVRACLLATAVAVDGDGHKDEDDFDGHEGRDGGNRHASSTVVVVIVVSLRWGR